VQRHCYWVAGHGLDSDIGLPGLIGIEDHGPAEITIARGDLALLLDVAAQVGPACCAIDGKAE
jgi:hypothetical protein